MFHFIQYNIYIGPAMRDDAINDRLKNYIVDMSLIFTRKCKNAEKYTSIFSKSTNGFFVNTIRMNSLRERSSTNLWSERTSYRPH